MMSTWLALFACGGEEPCEEGFGRAADGNCYPLTGDDDDDTALTDSPETDTLPVEHSGPSHSADSGGGTFTGPVLVMSASVTCASGVAEVSAETQGWTSGGLFYQIETGNQAPWAEEHDLESVAYGPKGSWDLLGVELLAGVGLGDLERNASTLFRCDTHYNQRDIMTYAVAVFDVNETLADCLAWGEDPRAVIDGTVLSPYNYERGPGFDTSICVVAAVSAR